MKLNLSTVELFESNELELKNINFIFGKNGTGKSTLTKEFKKLSSDYDVSIFQGFLDLIDSNKRLNAVVLGEENTSINRIIEKTKEEIESIKTKIDEINEGLQKPNDDSISNFWTRKVEAQKELEEAKNELEEFYSKSASKIKINEDNKEPILSFPIYNKRNFKDDIDSSSIMSDEEFKLQLDIIKSEIKVVPNIRFPTENFQSLMLSVNDILKKSVIEKKQIIRLENSIEKREFARKGCSIHKKGDVCAFCGNLIEESTWNELESYFSADEIKTFQNEITSKQNCIKLLIKQIDELNIDNSNFYPMYKIEAEKLDKLLEKKKKDVLKFLNALSESLDEKQKYLFEKLSVIDVSYSDNFDEIAKCYEKLRNDNNVNPLSEKQNEAKEKIRKHYVKKCLDDFGYDIKVEKLKTLELNERNRVDEYNKENEKITGVGGLSEQIQMLTDKIISLQNETKNENILAQNINKKLKHMVSFELVHFKDASSKGFYKVKSLITGKERDITELSTGERNIIAFLYFIEKLKEIKHTPVNKNRIIVFDDPMNSNDDGMQYLIVEELQNLMKKLTKNDFFVLLTHNKHFYLNVKYGYKYTQAQFVRFQSNGNKTIIIHINKENEDFRTNYEELWKELKILYELDVISADVLLNPIRRIIETFTKFNAIDKNSFCSKVEGAMKFFNVNSHSIDDLEAELNGKNKEDIINLFYHCFEENNEVEHFNKFWGELNI